MALLLRASCLLSLLLAGFVPLGRGQEKSKVSEPPGRKTSSLRPGVHRAAERATASPEAPGVPTLPCRGDPALRPSLSAPFHQTQTRVLRRAERTWEDSLHCHLGVVLLHSVSWDRLSHSVGFGEGVGS